MQQIFVVTGRIPISHNVTPKLSNDLLIYVYDKRPPMIFELEQAALAWNQNLEHCNIVLIREHRELLNQTSKWFHQK